MPTKIVQARRNEVGGMPVLRPLPTREQRSVGPFVFLDELGPVKLPAGHGLDVPPHPHIGLSTLTYRLTGELEHRDSLGCTQTVRPGAVNWMTAGHGVTHSERSTELERGPEFLVHGVQLWVALPPPHEEVEPNFEHHPEDSIPVVRRDGVELRILAGRAFGAESPVGTYSALFCVEALWHDEAAIELDPELGERAAYPLAGALLLPTEERALQRGEFAIFADGGPGKLRGRSGARALLLGGRARDWDLHMHWNFVASSPERILAARRRWADGDFPRVVGDDDAPVPDPAGRPR